MTEPMQGWSVTLGATAYSLVPATVHLQELEGVTGCTIFTLVNAAAEGALTIDHMALIVATLSQGPAKDPILVDRRGLAHKAKAPALAAAIVDAGIMAVMPRLILPLTAALSGKVDGNGIPKRDAV